MAQSYIIQQPPTVYAAPQPQVQNVILAPPPPPPQTLYVAQPQTVLMPSPRIMQPEVQTAIIQSSPAYQPTVIQPPIIQPTAYQPSVYQPSVVQPPILQPPPMFNPPPPMMAPITAPIGSQLPMAQPVGPPMPLTTQTNLDETTKDMKGQKICQYCHQEWKSLMVTKVSTTNTTIGIIFGVFFIIPGIVYCYCTRTSVDSCFMCHKCEKEDDYCFDF